ncbi:MAG: DUF5916 domain-containing protein [Gemmatimonadota bacterium]
MTRIQVLALVILMLSASSPLAAQDSEGDVSAASRALLGDGAQPIQEGRTAPEAQGVRELTRVSSPVTLDGILDEAAWAELDPLPLTMYEPAFRGSSQRKIDIRVGYDDEALYVGGRFFHDDPSDIRAFSVTRDRWSGDDGFAIFLDTFNDKENGVRLVALPLGARMDMSISGDGQQENSGGAGGPRGISWNTFWDARTTIHEGGWEGEMRIPFSSLRFETDSDGAVIMGLSVYAYEPAAGIRWTFPAIPPSAPYTQVSAWQEVRLQGIEPQNPVYVTPYVLTSSARSNELNPAGDAFQGVADRGVEIGGDVKLNPTRNLTLDLTVNTDFAAVEADQQQVNLTRFSLFFDEKRPFFQERAGIFSFETGADRGTLFYSRRIGLADGMPVRILGGARLVGRVGNWDLGVIQMQTAEDGPRASENFGVLRLRRRVLNTNSYLGGMATSRIQSGAGHNVTYGLDSQLRLFGDEYLTVKWLQTFQGGDALRDAAPGGMDAGRIMVDWTRRRVQGLSYQNVLLWSGPGYEPELGFELRQDFRRGQSDWTYQWFPGETSVLRRIWLGVESNIWVRNRDDRVDTGQIQPFVQVENNAGANVKLLANRTFEDVPADFSLSDDAFIPQGTYWANEVALEFGAARGWDFRPSSTLTVGDFFDGRRVGLNSRLNWPVNRYLEIVGGWEWNRIRFSERDQGFDANLVRLTARGGLNVHFSTDVFLQYNSLTDQVTTNARLRYNFREGQDLWFVWNEGINLEREVLGVPRLPVSDARSVTVKYTHTLAF